VTDQIHLRLGAPPWLPADTVRPGRVLNYYDIPLAGVLKQHGKYYLFECLEGEVQDTNLWAYVPISRTFARKLGHLAGHRLTSAMHDAYRDQLITVAMAVKGCIESGACVELRSDESRRREAVKAMKRKADRDSSAVDALAALV